MKSERKIPQAWTALFLAFTILFFGMVFGWAWNASVASYFGLRKMTYAEAFSFLQMVVSVTIIAVFTVKLFRSE